MEKKKHRLKLYDIQDMIKRIPKSQRIVDEKTFGHVVKAYFQNICDALLEYNDVLLPYGMGALKYTVVDYTPYYDTKTGKIRGGKRRPAYLKNPAHFDPNILLRVTYYKCTPAHNPFRFATFHKGTYIQKLLCEQYKNKNYNSVNMKKI